MFENNKILVVIPARGYSKNIPRKNLRLLGEKPLIYYSIDIAKSSKYVDDVVVSTEDSEIASIVEKYGTSVVKRPVELATDETLLDTVIYDAMLQKEKQAFDEYDIVITIQPSSPLLKTETLDKAIEKFADFNIDSVISVVDDKNLRWGFDDENGRYFPFYSERLYRDLLPKTFKETGGILATRRNFVTETSRLGLNIDLIEISREESVEINTYEDWWIANNYLNKIKIAFVVDAYDQIVIAHILYELYLVQSTLHKSLGCHTMIFLYQVFFKRATVYTDADRDISFLCYIYHSPYSVSASYIAGIDSDLVGSVFNRSYCKLVIKVYIRNKRYADLFLNLLKCPCSLHRRHSTSDYITA